MKRLLLFTVLISLLSQCTQNDKMIYGHRVGDLKIGGTEDIVLSKLKNYQIDELSNTNDELYKNDKYYNVYEKDQLILSLMFSFNKLRAIQVHGKNFYTSRGTTVGHNAQKVLDMGHRFRAITEHDYSFVAHTDEEDVYFYFEKKMTKNQQIGRFAELMSISVGQVFDIKEVKKEAKINKKNGHVKDNTFYSRKFNMELAIPDDWANKTDESNVSTVEELLFIENDKDETSLVIVAQKLRNNEIKSGFQYFSHEELKILKFEVISDTPVSIAGKEFYMAKTEIQVNERKQKQLMYCTIKDQYAIVITGKYYNDEHENVVKGFITSIRTHNP